MHNRVEPTRALHIFMLCVPVMLSVPPAATAGGEEDISVAPGQRQLFLDDLGIAKMENLKRTMHQPAKKGAVIEPDLPWETVLQVRSSPAWDTKEKKFKLWMTASTVFPGVGGTTSAESKDGINWTKPIMRQMELDGSLENNFITVEPGLTWPANSIKNVVYDPDDPDPSRRYKGFGHCYGREPIVSAEGIHWRRLNVPRIPSQDESNMSYDRRTRTFLATLKQNGPHGRSVGLSTSKDFEHWTEPELIFHTDDLDQELAHRNIRERLANPDLQQPVDNNPADYRADVYNMGVFRYEGLYVGLPAVYHSTGKHGNNTDGFHVVQLVCSRDLHHWHRLGDRKPFIGPSLLASGAYDRTQILPPSSPLVRGDEVWFYYTGIKYRVHPDNADTKTGAVCLAVLRRDGFISLDAGEKEGLLVTKPLTVRGDRLYVNVDASKGWISVEALDGDGRTIAASKRLTGDHARGEVKWSRGSLGQLKGKTATLRFTLSRASFYSFWIE
jgi:hypothetical protein